MESDRSKHPEAFFRSLMLVSDVRLQVGVFHPNGHLGPFFIIVERPMSRPNRKVIMEDHICVAILERVNNPLRGDQIRIGYKQQAICCDGLSTIQNETMSMRRFENRFRFRRRFDTLSSRRFDTLPSRQCETRPSQPKGTPINKRYFVCEAFRVDPLDLPL
ncbi:hypothetical protein JAAARDRAFT_35939 [Jaapia argillacea MUCL 33604]|uniref:Uncharacterized protein n=1 Tax=Jaapia argillacea MUCL 33604 TaxID=933084 RepID=A0A067PRB9_9AGAM|nr:hypothetical protein JAAARDRAFT_35939 [Jaapia argillacea MUCL 33604]